MSTRITPSTSRGSSGSGRSARTAPQSAIRPILIALAAVVVLAGIGLGVAVISGATIVFNLLVWTLFTVLWIAFAAAVISSPGTLDDLWQQTRRLPVVYQGVIWLLFLPIMIGLWLWERTWALPIRLVLVIALGAWNVFLFFPRSM